MIRIHLNGLKLVPGVDYTSTNHIISFLSPPAPGDQLLITSGLPGGGAHMQRFVGDGFTFLFKLDSSFEHRIKLQAMLDDVWTYHNVPAVHDVLEQLQVVLELVKQDTPLKTL
jgi:hypothetical protein